MLLKISFILITAYALGKIAEKCRLPALLGYIVSGLLVSPYSNIEILTHFTFSKSELLTSGPLRTIALFVIMFRAGLGLDKNGLKENGSAAIKLSFIPCLCETLTISIICHFMLQFPWLESALIGFAIAAVSPAVIVPMMLELKQKKLGTNKSIPTLILASATIDDIIAITGFGIVLSLLSVSIDTSWLTAIIFLPFAIITGVAAGLLLFKPLEPFLFGQKYPTYLKISILILIAFLLKRIEDIKLFPFSYLLAIMTLGYTIRDKMLHEADQLADGFYKVWKIAEIILFVLIGAMVDLNLAMKMGFTGLIILTTGLIVRAISTYLSLTKTQLTSKEKIFCTFSYLPKATVQATIGGIALTAFYEGSIKLYNGAEMGEFILAMAAMSILITAPLGAIAIKVSSKKLLQFEPKTGETSDKNA